MKLGGSRIRIPRPAANPIVVKELRQAVRSRFVSGGLLLFQLAQLLIVGFTLLGLSSNYAHDVGATMSTGRTMFSVLFAALTAACVGFIPLYTGIRMGLERWDNNLDLLFITTIKPSAIIRGKLLAAMAIATLLFSAAMPFMSFTYLLRGIDLPSVFIVLLMCFCLVLVVSQAILFLACLPTSRVFKVIIALATVGWLVPVVVSVNVGGFEMIRSGIGSQLHDRDFWIVTGSLLYCFGIAFGFLHVLSVALISPPSANRSIGIRLFATFAWISGGIIVLSVGFHEGVEEILLAWLIPSMIVLTAAIGWAASETRELSARVAQRIPRSRILRCFVFPFYSGPASGILWACTLAACTIAITYVSAIWIDHGFASVLLWGTRGFKGVDSDVGKTMHFLGTLFLYVLAYSLGARTIWRGLLKRQLRCSCTWVIAMLLLALGSLLPLLAGLVMRLSTWDEPLLWHVGNVATIASREHKVAHLYFAGFAAAAMLVLNARWFWTQLRAFRRPATPPPLKTDTPPTENA